MLSGAEAAGGCYASDSSLNIHRHPNKILWCHKEAYNPKSSSWIIVFGSWIQRTTRVSLILVAKSQPQIRPPRFVCRPPDLLTFSWICWFISFIFIKKKKCHVSIKRPQKNTRMSFSISPCDIPTNPCNLLPSKWLCLSWGVMFSVHILYNNTNVEMNFFFFGRNHYSFLVVKIIYTSTLYKVCTFIV
jgi:hypothetical protein